MFDLYDAYVANDPVNATDPTGMWLCKIFPCRDPKIDEGYRKRLEQSAVSGY